MASSQPPCPRADAAAGLAVSARGAQRDALPETYSVAGRRSNFTFSVKLSLTGAMPGGVGAERGGSRPGTLVTPGIHCVAASLPARYLPNASIVNKREEMSLGGT